MPLGLASRMTLGQHNCKQRVRSGDGGTQFEAGQTAAFYVLQRTRLAPSLNKHGCWSEFFGERNRHDLL